MSITRDLASALCGITDGDLPRHTIEHTERAVLDWLGSALAGSTEPPAQMAHRFARGLGVSGEATMVAGGRASAAAAAFANGVASHILELDDIHKGSTIHGAAPIIPAALAVAEREHATGHAFLTAVAIGYEVAFRIGEAVNPSHYRYWHPTGTVATFGAAAAAAQLLRLTPEEMVHALGSAGTQAAGLWEFNADGAMSKHLHPGKAAMNGVIAADLARTGFTGAARIVEGERGFARAMSDAADLSAVTRGLGVGRPVMGRHQQVSKICENGYKLHACCGHTHSAIDVALQLRTEQGWSGDDAVANVMAVEVATYGPGYEIVREMCPRTPYQAKFSMAYCVAVALLEGRAGLEQFSADRFGSDGVSVPPLRRLLERTRVRVADDLTAKYPEAWPARVIVTLNDGTTLCGASDYPRGNAENPVTIEDLREKFIGLVTPRLGRGVCDRALGALAKLPNSPDVSTVFSKLLTADR